MSQEREVDTVKIETLSPYYPIWLDLNGKSCVVVGGGAIAERRIGGLLRAQADVTVISPEVTPAIADWIDKGQVKGIFVGYDSQYSMDAYLVIAATNSTKVNIQVFMDASERGQLINRVDDPEQSGFIVPAVVRRGNLIIAVSTAGASPSLVGEIRDELEMTYGEEYEAYVDFLGDLRLLVQERMEDPIQRRRILKDVLALPVLDAIRNGTFDKEQLLAQLLEGDFKDL